MEEKTGLQETSGVEQELIENLTPITGKRSQDIATALLPILSVDSEDKSFQEVVQPLFSLLPGKNRIVFDRLRKIRNCLIVMVEAGSLQQEKESIFSTFEALELHFLDYSEEIRKKKEEVAIKEALEDSRNKFRDAFTASAYGMVITSIQGQFQEVNDAFLAVSGYSSEELSTMTLDGITHPDDVEKGVNLLIDVLNREITHYSLEKRLFHKNGSLIQIELSQSVVFSPHGRPLFFVGHVIDISVRKEVENCHKKSEYRLDTALKLSGAGIIEHTVPVDKNTWFSDRCLEIGGYESDDVPKDETVFSWALGLVHPDDAWQLKEDYKAFIDGKKEFFNTTLRIKRKGGEWIPVHLIGRAVNRDAKGKATHVIGVVFDMTDESGAK